jgi:hypothetical protein
MTINSLIFLSSILIVTAIYDVGGKKLQVSFFSILGIIGVIMLK